MHQIGMSDKKPMAGAERVPEVKYSAAYSTGRERIGAFTLGPDPIVFNRSGGMN